MILFPLLICGVMGIYPMNVNNQIFTKTVYPAATLPDNLQLSANANATIN
jgi:hypothetical protein